MALNRTLPFATLCLILVSTAFPAADALASGGHRGQGGGEHPCGRSRKGRLPFEWRRPSAGTRRAPCVRRRSVTIIASSTGSGCSPKTAESSKCGSTRQPAARTESCACWCWKTSRHCARRWCSFRAIHHRRSCRRGRGELGLSTRSMPRSWFGCRGVRPMIRAWRKAGRAFVLIRPRDSRQGSRDRCRRRRLRRSHSASRSARAGAGVAPPLGGWSQPLIRCGAVTLDTRARVGRRTGRTDGIRVPAARIPGCCAGQVVSRRSPPRSSRTGFRARQQYDRLHRPPAPQARPR